MLYICYVFVLDFASIVPVSQAVSAMDMKTHLSTTFNNYDIRIRPISDQSSPVHVTIDVYLIGINNFDSSAQKLTTTAYLVISK